MDSGKILVLFKGAPLMIPAASLRKEQTIESAAFRSLSGEDEIASGNDPGDQDK